MYSPQITVKRIKDMISTNRTSLSKINEACGLNRNTITVSANSKTGLNAKALFDVSNQLNCSVDYLLGKTDNPNVVGGTYINGNNNNNGTQAINGNVSVNTNNNEQDDKQLLELIKSLSLVERAEAIIYLNNLKTKK